MITDSSSNPKSRGQIGGLIRVILDPPGDTVGSRTFNGKSMFHTIHRMLWLRGVSLPPPATTYDVASGSGSLCICAAQGLPGYPDSYDLGPMSWLHQLGFSGPPHSGCAACDIVDDGENEKMGIKTQFGDVQDLLPDVPADSHDQVIASEILEHLHESQWPDIVGHCYRICRFQAMITVPDWQADASIGKRCEQSDIDLHGIHVHQYEPTEHEWYTFWKKTSFTIPDMDVEVTRIPGSLTARLTKKAFC